MARLSHGGYRMSPRLLMLVVAAACGTPAAQAPHETNVEQGRPPVVGARIIGIVFRLAGSGEELPPDGGVVYLDDGRNETEMATASVELSAKSFSPLTVVVQPGAVVTFTNKDVLPHHVFSPDLKGWDTGVLRPDQHASRRFETPGVVTLLCNIHPEMLGYVLVIPSAPYGRIGSDGRYVIPNVHAGTYKITAWAPRTRTATQSVTVGATGAVTVDFHLQPQESFHD